MSENVSLRERAAAALETELAARKAREQETARQQQRQQREQSAARLRAALAANTEIVPAGEYKIRFDDTKALVEYEDFLLGAENDRHLSLYVSCPECHKPV